MTIAADRMKTMGYGPDKPIADISTTEGRAKNRHIEFLPLE
jgi:outer membrane protein OmpA-like peptidoglycan-associated protein